MGRQENVFLEDEGDQWFLRNKDRIRTDPVFDATTALDIKPEYVTEVGCGTGWRLSRYATNYKAHCFGIDPSQQAINTGRVAWDDLGLTPHITLRVAGAARGLYGCTPANLLIFGFCLYLCDRGDLMKIVHDGDASLLDGGYLAIQDFDPEYAHKVPYHHREGLFSYKMNYAKLWLANPAYSLVRKNSFMDGTAVWVLKKDVAAGWPEEAMP